VRVWPLLLALLWLPALAKTHEARVIHVIDGDTLVLNDGARKTTVRIADIDAPELAQAFGDASRAALAGLTLHKVVQVTPRTTDEYGRVIGEIAVNGVNVSDAQLRAGLAWEYSRHQRKRALKALENQARRAQRGLWSQPNPVPPWMFRQSPGAQSKGAPERAQRALESPRHARVCGNKRHCSQMLSCAEARFYFTKCGVKSLDKNGNGVACENLCAAR